MTNTEFNQNYQIGQRNTQTGEVITFEDYQYACEVWQSMTDTEKKQCSVDKMNKYIADTYDYIKESEDNYERY